MLIKRQFNNIFFEIVLLIDTSNKTKTPINSKIKPKVIQKKVLDFSFEIF